MKYIYDINMNSITICMINGDIYKNNYFTPTVTKLIGWLGNTVILISMILKSLNESNDKSTIINNCFTPTDYESL